MFSPEASKALQLRQLSIVERVQSASIVIIVHHTVNNLRGVACASNRCHEFGNSLVSFYCFKAATNTVYCAAPNMRSGLDVLVVGVCDREGAIDCHVGRRVLREGASSPSGEHRRIVLRRYRDLVHVAFRRELSRSQFLLSVNREPTFRNIHSFYYRLDTEDCPPYAFHCVAPVRDTTTQRSARHPSSPRRGCNEMF